MTPTCNSHSYFWRHPEQMEALAQHLRRFDAGASLRVWCAGCAQGEEPYSVAFLLDSLGFDFRITGTDISLTALQAAQLAVYRPDKLRLLPDRFRMKVLSEHELEVPERIRNRVEFSRSDLLQDECSPSAFDVIFCRNVLIYFSEDQQAEILNMLTGALNREGILVLGYAESSLITVKGLYRLDEHGIFSKRVQERPRRARPVPVTVGADSVELAIRNYAFGKLHQARSLFRNSLEETPGFVLGHYFIALINLELGALGDAQEHLDSVLHADMVMDPTTQSFLRERKVSERQFLKSAVRVQQRIEALR